jgi:hypothetical protein
MLNARERKGIVTTSHSNELGSKRLGMDADCFGSVFWLIEVNILQYSRVVLRSSPVLTYRRPGDYANTRAYSWVELEVAETCSWESASIGGLLQSERLVVASKTKGRDELRWEGVKIRRGMAYSGSSALGSGVFGFKVLTECERKYRAIYANSTEP